MAAVLWTRRERQGVKPLWSWTKLRDRQGWQLVVVFTVAANFTTNIVYFMLFRDTATPDLNEGVLQLLRGSSALPWTELLALFAGMVILAPLSEEWLFRGVLQGALCAR